MSKPTEQSNKQKKSCRNCAYLHSGFVGLVDLTGKHEDMMSESFRCKRDDSSIDNNEVDTKVCKKFMRSKKGMSLEQQEHSKLSNRLKRNWYYVSALTIALIGLIIAIWKLILGK